MLHSTESQGRDIVTRVPLTIIMAPLCTSTIERSTCEAGLAAWVVATGGSDERVKWKGGFLQARACVLSDSTMKQGMTRGVVVGQELQEVYFYLSH